MSKYIKIILIAVVLLIFVISIPASFFNSRAIDKAKNDIKLVIDEVKKVCDSNCAYIPENMIDNNEREDAKSYCLEHYKDNCTNNMLSFREGLDKTFEMNFENQYYLRVAQIYCIIGLRCYGTEVRDFIFNYKP